MPDPKLMPPALIEAIAAELADVPTARVVAAARRVSERYRAKGTGAAAALSGAEEVAAYLAVRMPATFAATARVFVELLRILPDFAPQGMIDAGAGPGTVTLAAATLFPSVQESRLIERHAGMAAAGRRLVASALPHLATDWATGDMAATAGRAELIAAGYALGEVPPHARPRAVAALGNACGDVLVLIEPGTPEGFATLMAARAQLLAAGFGILAPCPHGLPCPMVAPAFCRFAVRFDRGRIAMAAKDASRGYEDEPFAYLIARRGLGEDARGKAASARIVAPPRRDKIGVHLALCRADGTLGPETVSVRDKVAHRAATKRDWGDAFLPPLPEGAKQAEKPA